MKHYEIRTVFLKDEEQTLIDMLNEGYEAYQHNEFDEREPEGEELKTFVKIYFKRIIK
jgi:hypothetical protein